MINFERRTLLSALAAVPISGVVSGSVSAQSEMKDITLTKAPKFRGVVYDVGLNFSGTELSVETFDPALVEYDIKAISNSLHANAVRIEGEVIDRLVAASRIAHKQGLAVFFNPWKMNADATELVAYYKEAAKAAETLRKDGVDIVFVAGCEYPIFQKGLLPGDTLAERLAGLGSVFGSEGEAGKTKISNLWSDLNKYLKSFAAAVRSEFDGPVTYAATSFEQVDWSVFDIVGVDHYRGAETAEEYIRQFDSYKVNKKPVVCMEVGSCAYVGAAKAGGGGFTILEGTNPDGSGNFKGGVVPTRSEREQADYVETQVKLLANNDAAGIFIYVFSFPVYPHGEGAKDLDLVSFSLVKTYPANDARSKAMPPWAPKEAFYRLAGLFERMKLERRAILSGAVGLPLLGTLCDQVWAKSEMDVVGIQQAPKYRGVVYDLGLNFKDVHDMGLNAPDGLSVEAFNPTLVEFEITAIRHVLNANAIRIEGEIIERLIIASRIAHKQGLTVFFNPWKMNATAAELQPYYAEAARAAEILRSEGVDIIFVMGCEFSLFQKGIFPGDTINERVAGIGPIFAGGANSAREAGSALWKRFNATLKPLVDSVRGEFKGSVTYAALIFEQVDWTMFDIVGIDHYRGTETAKEYVETLNRYRIHKKPIVCMEVGSCTYAGAAKAGGGGFVVLEGTEPDGTGRFKDGRIPERSEREQADYVETQVKLLANSGVEGLFVFSFSMPMYPTGDGAKDLDRVSYALVKTYPKADARSEAMPPWAPKEAFHRLANLYADMDNLRT